jgi:hypothetical protein
MSQPTPTPASTANFTSPIADGEGTTDAGIQSCGGWANNLTSPPWWNTPNQVLEQIPAPVNVQLGGTAGVRQVGSPQQWAVTIHLGDTLQIVPTMANAQNVAVAAVAPNVFTYQYASRQSKVCTVDANGLITATGRGEAEVEVISPRACNLPFPGAAPSGTEGVRASLLVTVVA